MVRTKKKIVKRKWLKGVINSIARSKPRKFIQTRSRLSALPESSSVSSTGYGNRVAITSAKRVRSTLATSTEPSFSVSMGRNPTRINESQMQYIRDQLVPTKQYLKTVPKRLIADFGECEYYEFESCMVDDINYMASSIDATDPNLKFNINSAHMTLMLQNQSTAGAYLRVYEYIARHDVPSTLTSLNTIVREGFQSIKTTAQILHTDYGGKLFANPLFCTYFKIGTVKEVKLDQGETVTLHLNDENNKLINMQLLTNALPLALGSYSKGYVIQVWGQIARSTDTEKQLTLTKPAIDVIQTVNYTYKPISKELVATYTNGGIESSTAPVVFVNQGDGALANPTWAGAEPFP